MKKLFFCFIFLFCFSVVLSALSLQELAEYDTRAVLKNYPDAQTVLLYDDQQITFETDGTAVDVDDMYQKALTDKGVQNLRSIPLHFNEFYEKYHIEVLELIRDGKIIPVNVRENSRISIDNSQMSANIFDPADKILFLNIPGMQVNDILHLKLRRQTLRPRMKGFFTDITVLQSDDPILYYKVQYNAPASMPLKSILVKNELKGKIKIAEMTEKNRHIYAFTATDVPQIVPEPDAPPMYLYCQRLLVSTASCWEDISRWYSSLCEPHLQKVTPEMKDFVRNLIKDCRTPDEKLRKIFDFVAKDVRYMGVTNETEAPGYEPHDVNITFEKRYGVCRDKAALLVALLRLADIPAYMTLFYAGAPKDAEVPNNYFNHAIVAAQLPGRTDYVLMDPTDENSSDLLPAYGANKSYLVARSQGDTLRLSSEIDYRKNSVVINNKWQIDNDGNLNGISEISFYGINDNMYRDAFANWNKEYTRQFFNVLFNRIFPGAEISSIVISPSNIRDLGKILKVDLTFSVKKFVTFDGKIAVIPEHSLGSMFGALNMMMRKVNLEKRRYPMQFFSTAGIEENTEIRFADNKIKVELPSFRKLQNGIYICNTENSFSDGVLSEKNISALTRTIISGEEYSSLRNQLKEAAAEKRKKILIMPADVMHGAQNILIYQDVHTVKFKDARNWTDVYSVKYKVLDYAGVKSHAELSIPFDSGCENVTLFSASVKNPDGKTYTTAPSEVHIMDSGNTADAPYYMPAKIFTVKFPHVVPGSVIEYKIGVEHKNMPFYYGKFVFASDYDTEWQEVIFENIPPEFRMSPLPHNVNKLTGKNSITVYKKNIRRTGFEIKQPPLAMFKDTVYCTTLNFQEYCSELNRRLNTAAGNSRLVREKTSELIKNCKTPLEKVTVIRDFVDRNIRLAGPALNDYNWIFSTADDTLKRSYGNSADRAVLLKAMLDTAGLKSEFIVRSNSGMAEIMNRHYINSLRYFQNDYNRVLLNVYDGKNLIAVLNENSRYAPVNLDRSMTYAGLNLPQKMPLRRVDNVPGKVNKIVVLRINPDLSVIADVTLKYYGTEAESLRRFFAESNSTQKKQFFERKTMEFSRQAVQKEAWKIKDDNHDVVILYGVLELHNIISQNGRYAVLELPYIKELANSIPAVSGRTAPLWFNEMNQEEIRFCVEIPEDYIFCNLPEQLTVNREIGNIYSLSREIFLPSSDRPYLSGNIFLRNKIGMMDEDNAAALPALKKLLSSPEFNLIFLQKR